MRGNSLFVGDLFGSVWICWQSSLLLVPSYDGDPPGSVANCYFLVTSDLRFFPAGVPIVIVVNNVHCWTSRNRMRTVCFECICIHLLPLMVALTSGIVRQLVDGNRLEALGPDPRKQLSQFSHSRVGT